MKDFLERCCMSKKSLLFICIANGGHIIILTTAIQTRAKKKTSQCIITIYVVNLQPFDISNLFWSNINSAKYHIFIFHMNSNSTSDDFYYSK